ncbi:excalibur calcium-binding domain-containing protein [Pseudonocardia kunmingensis]|uniref:Excalibur calcium-binding domain-containing protein n=1 Tax=Pseudonocardia kunmingensis TaxID=630975 RepID=A0A543DA81_9PSEU|nr:excalibur calcium-binding domain-containing protein [Pseudonocardia kunmingensis]TQM06254.1 excalibur calcium-binding domain-containing protein [Pseudonocardia kunmingensis]
MAPVSAPRRRRAAVFAATLTAALVVAMAGTALAAEDLDCSDFDHQEEAQAVLEEDRSDPHRLDGGPDGAGDGVACESLPRRGDADDAGVDEDADEDAPATTPATPAEDDGDGDRDCPDFATQAAAQAALARGAGDRERLDADDDGIACERHFGTEGRQVAVFPQGGVATGGVPRP